jgi:hypothetical protein
MRALVLLARSLDWNVMQKHNTPVVITSRAGIQRRLPTDTAVRMSYFQQQLSAIILNSTLEPTIELIDKIIATTKPSEDHKRRLRLAVGETPQQHRERLINARGEEYPEWTAAPIEEALEIPTYEDQLAYNAEQQAPEPEMTWEDPPEKSPQERKSSRERKKTSGVKEGPADGGDHGKLVRVEAFKAKASTRSNKAYRYTSLSCDERTWSDGYIDYTCQVCGLAFPTSRGVGSHRQRHIQAGVASRTNNVRNTFLSEPWQPTPQTGKYSKKKAETQSPVIEPEPEPELEEMELVETGTLRMPSYIASEHTPDRDKIQEIIKIVLPEYVKLAEEVVSLRADNDDLRARLAKLQGEWDALRALISGPQS